MMAATGSLVRGIKSHWQSCNTLFFLINWSRLMDMCLFLQPSTIAKPSQIRLKSSRLSRCRPVGCLWDVVLEVCCTWLKQSSVKSLCSHAGWSVDIPTLAQCHIHGGKLIPCGVSADKLISVMYTNTASGGFQLTIVVNNNNTTTYKAPEHVLKVTTSYLMTVLLGIKTLYKFWIVIYLVAGLIVINSPLA